MTTKELRDKWAAMTDEQRRVAVAECAGFNGACAIQFTRSLDAIAQAVAGMNDKQYEQYVRELMVIVFPDCANKQGWTWSGLPEIIKLLKATAAQRAEAFWLAMQEGK